MLPWSCLQWNWFAVCAALNLNNQSSKMGRKIKEDNGKKLKMTTQPVTHHRSMVTVISANILYDLLDKY